MLSLVEEMPLSPGSQTSLYSAHVVTCDVTWGGGCRGLTSPSVTLDLLTFIRLEELRRSSTDRDPTRPRRGVGACSSETPFSQFHNMNLKVGLTMLRGFHTTFQLSAQNQ